MTNDDAPTRPQDPPPPERTYLVDGQQRYRVEDRLGVGAFGAVFKCWHEQTDTWVAVKRLHVPEADAVRLMREATLVGQVESDYVAHPRACFYDAPNALLYIVADFAAEGDLGGYLRGRQSPLPMAEALELSLAIARGVAAMHSRQIVHRDIKPANILMYRRDGRVFPRLADFGLARNVSTASVGEFASPGYSAPEQLAFEGAGLESDLFSLGLVLYEVLTGTRASDAQDLPSHAVWLRGLQRRPLGPPSSVRPELARTAALDTVVSRLTAWDRDGRKRLTAGQVVDASQEALDGVAAQPQAFVPLRPDSRRVSWKTVVVGLAVVLGAVYAAKALVDRSATQVPPAPVTTTPKGIDDTFGGSSSPEPPQTAARGRSPEPVPPVAPTTPPSVDQAARPTVSPQSGPPLPPVNSAEVPTSPPTSPPASTNPAASPPPTGAPAATAPPPPPKNPLDGEWMGHVDDPSSRPSRLQIEVALTSSGDTMSGAVVIDGKCKGTLAMLERTAARTWFEQRLESGNCVPSGMKVRAGLSKGELEVQFVGATGQSLWHGWLRPSTGDTSVPSSREMPSWAPGTFTGVNCVERYGECRLVITAPASVKFQVWNDMRAFISGPIRYTDIPCDWEVGLNRISCTLPQNRRTAYDVTDTATGIALVPVGGRGRLALKRTNSK